MVTNKREVLVSTLPQRVIEYKKVGEITSLAEKQCPLQHL